MARKSVPAIGITLTADEMALQVFGERADDVLGPARWGVDALDKLEALFRAIARVESGPTAFDQVKALAGLGEEFAADSANTIGAQYDRLREHAGLQAEVLS